LPGVVDEEKVLHVVVFQLWRTSWCRLHLHLGHAPWSGIRVGGLRVSDLVVGVRGASLSD